MYIAFKWLICISMGMWISICCLDYLILKKMQRLAKLAMSEFSEIANAKNQTNFAEKYSAVKVESHFLYHYVTFVAGGVVVAVFNNKTKIFYWSRSKLVKWKIPDFKEKVRSHIESQIADLKVIWEQLTISNITDMLYWVANKYHLQQLWVNLKNRLFLILVKTPEITETEITSEDEEERVQLDQKLKIVLDERKGLVKVLTAVMRDNSNMKVKYKLEIMAKERLSKRMEEYQKNLKAIRAQQTTFQYLYMATCQKNVFLRALVEKLTREKRIVERNLTELVNAVYNTKNSQLKTFCSKFLVGSASSILKTDMTAEVHKFLKNSPRPLSIEQSQSLPLDNSDTSSATRLAKPQIGEASTLEGDYPRFSKLKVAGTKGDYIVTVKDREGLIEKMYEYNSKASSDAGDTIRSIRREYSVFHDRDCVVEYKFQPAETPTCSRTTRPRFTASRHFLTHSAAFQDFLRANGRTGLQLTQHHQHHPQQQHHHYQCHCHCAVDAY